ncbi:CHAT domain-containing protein [Desulfovibrio sp. UCD-KL4C]|uniref:CHAT domain-containing protein n=1 Tax=Desulfovibrio sp. UCD-KL4C TaxID=2578120 RepID=UPI0025BEF9D6|nr:CHAT domain-containing protein [Desulfovibrio sp. UCD-KL4C]
MSKYYLKDYKISKTQFGIQDPSIQHQIETINSVTAAKEQKDFARANNLLLGELDNEQDNCAKALILNQLADIFSYNTLELEKAVKADQDLLAISSGCTDSKYKLKYSSANNVLLAVPSYKEKYFDPSYAQIQKHAQKRLRQNEGLLKEGTKFTGKNYTKEQLINHVSTVKHDIARALDKPTKNELISRLIRGEFELYKTTRNADWIADGYKYFLNNKIVLNDVDLDEINFLALSSYLHAAYLKTSNVVFEELAFSIILKPYLNIESSAHRWAYNKLINSYINNLVGAYYKQKNFTKALYYISLNKSRMILEDKAGMYSENKSIKDTMVTHSDLPDYASFEQKLSTTPSLIDFYIRADAEKTRKINFKSAKTELANSYTSVRSLIRKSQHSKTSIEIPVYSDTYITVKNNNSISMKRLSENESMRMKKALENCYKRITEFKTPAASDIRAIKAVIPGRVPVNTIISTDKWISSHPIGAYLGISSIRVLNAFMLAPSHKLNNIMVAGYFNPSTQNYEPLPDADKELAYLQKIYPDGIFFAHEKATLDNLSSDIQANIVHLSTHGIFDYAEPNESKLLFADDTFLYAKQMATFPQLKNKELIFTAACTTGKTRNDVKNSSEILGILRPLLINNNKFLILTLWEVDSKSAGEFVREFYTILKDKKDITEAFHLAVKKLKDKYKLPYYWAPYYIIANG